jgi:hypothetical protein
VRARPEQRIDIQQHTGFLPATAVGTADSWKICESGVRFTEMLGDTVQLYQAVFIVSLLRSEGVSC